MSATAAWLTVVLGGAFVLVWLVLVAWALYTALRWWAEQRAPYDTIQARVSGLITRKHKEKPGVLQTRLVYMLEFITDSGEQMTVEATPAEYESVQQGERVTLRIRNGRIIGFDTVEGSDGDDVYTRIVKDP